MGETVSEVKKLIKAGNAIKRIGKSCISLEIQIEMINNIKNTNVYKNYTSFKSTSFKEKSLAVILFFFIMAWKLGL